MFHATSLRHLMSQHISPRTTVFYIWHHITPLWQSASHHHFTPPHLKAQHSTSQPQSTSHHSTSTTIPHHTHIQHHSTFHTTPYSTSHTTSSWFYIVTPPQLTTHCIIFHIWRHTSTAHCICHILHHHNSTPPHFTSPNFPHFALCNIPHNEAPQSTPRHIRHRTFSISHHTRSENATFHIAPHFTYTSHHISHRTIIHLKSLHHMSAHHFTCPHHAHRHNQI